MESRPDLNSMWVSEENIFFAEKNSNEVSLFKNGEMVKDSLERTQAATNIDLVLYFFGSLLSSLTLQEKSLFGQIKNSGFY